MKTKMAFSLKTGVAQVWRCHTTFETGVAAATLATTLWAPLSISPLPTELTRYCPGEGDQKMTELQIIS